MSYVILVISLEANCDKSFEVTNIKKL